MRTFFSKSILGIAMIVMSSQSFGLETQQKDRQLIIELENLKESLSEQELSLSKLAHLKSLEEKMSADVHQELTQKNDLIQKYSKLSQKSQQETNNVDFDFTDRVKYEIQKRQLSSRLLESNKKVESLQSKLQQTQHKFKNLKKVFTRHDYETTLTITQMSEHIDQLTKALEQGHQGSPKQQNASAALVAQQSKSLSKLRKLENDLKAKARNIAHFKEELNLKQQAYDELIKVNRKLSAALLKSEQKIDYLVRKNSDLKTQVANIQSQNASLERYVQNLEKDAQITQTKLEGRIANLSSSQNIGPSRAPASLDHEEKSKLLEHFKTAKFRLEELGENQVSLTIDDYYLFNSGSARINELSKAKLLHLITLYTEEFLNRDFKREIISIDFVGHASPRYKSNYVNPLEASNEAYQYNLDLSLQRAQALVRVLLSPNFGDFPNKEQFREKIQVIGKSFTSPIPHRSPAQSSRAKCGPFDCQKSQRVEIIFKLGPTKK